jgi:Uma2 family endonuclease
MRVGSQPASVPYLAERLSAYHARTTEATDRREKALHYRQIPTLEEYVLVAQESSEVTIYRRANSWRHVRFCSPQDVAELKSIDLSLPLTEIYAGLAAHELSQR